MRWGDGKIISDFRCWFIIFFCFFHLSSRTIHNNGSTFMHAFNELSWCARISTDIGPVAVGKKKEKKMCRSDGEGEGEVAGSKSVCYLHQCCVTTSVMHCSSNGPEFISQQQLHASAVEMMMMMTVMVPGYVYKCWHFSWFAYERQMK